ncbi:helix-turn-helix domain-containing protein [Gordonia alkaliphila]|uniref:helix-turn-helix domain-containing protein n=1 Tax=Gordonia alkaliphila TaxID=1053547 RepID=UPI001FF40205|nr:helix-turn-helix transcriptional regulator [Gordonia alkaliphila]MCK0441158.1 helix-turn-helix domain-containing protein [Gordonia alkaliphila]
MIVSGELLRRRKMSGLTQGQVADRFTEAGYPIKLAAYASIESGKTRITVDMLTVAAAVFDCSPTALLLGDHEDPEATLEFQGPGTTTVESAADWLRMEQPFRAPGHDRPGVAAVVRFQSSNFPACLVTPIERALDNQA